MNRLYVYVTARLSVGGIPNYAILIGRSKGPLDLINSINLIYTSLRIQFI